MPIGAVVSSADPRVAPGGYWLRYLALAFLVGLCSLVGEVTWELLIVGHRIAGRPFPLIRVLGVLVLGAAFGACRSQHEL